MVGKAWIIVIGTPQIGHCGGVVMGVMLVHNSTAVLICRSLDAYRMGSILMKRTGGDL